MVDLVDLIGGSVTPHLGRNRVELFIRKGFESLFCEGHWHSLGVTLSLRHSPKQNSGFQLVWFPFKTTSRTTHPNAFRFQVIPLASGHVSFSRWRTWENKSQRDVTGIIWALKNGGPKWLALVNEKVDYNNA